MDVLVATLEAPPGWTVRATLGMVVGSYGRAVNRFTDQVKALFPGDIRNHPRELANARMTAVSHLKVAAADIGANGVIGVRMTHRQIGESWVELCAYGTAVILEPNTDRDYLP